MGLLKKKLAFSQKDRRKSDVFFLFPFFGPNICCFWGYCRTPNGLSFKNFCVVENSRAHAKPTKTERRTKTDRDIFWSFVAQTHHCEEAKEEDFSACARTLIYVYKCCSMATERTRRVRKQGFRRLKSKKLISMATIKSMYLNNIFFYNTTVRQIKIWYIQCICIFSYYSLNSILGSRDLTAGNQITLSLMTSLYRAN